MSTKRSHILNRGRSRDFEKGGVLYVGHHGWAVKRIIGFRMSKNNRNNVRNYKFLAKYFYQYSQVFSIFIDQTLSIFQIY